MSQERALDLTNEINFPGTEIDFSLLDLLLVKKIAVRNFSNFLYFSFKLKGGILHLLRK